MTSYEFHTNFIYILKSLSIISCKLQLYFIWAAYEVHMKLSCNLYRFDTNFIWSAYEVCMKLTCVFLYKIIVKFTWSSYEVFMKLMWKSDDLHMKFLWITYVIHVKCTRKRHVIIKTTHTKFIRTSCSHVITHIQPIQRSLELHAKYIWNSYKIQKWFTRSSCEAMDK